MSAESARGTMPQRLLRLLSLLQARREWSGGELTERLGVSARTLRRDVDRLRDLDYRVAGTPGAAGGYRLISGRDLPPLLLDDEEAVAIALALATATGVEESALRALAKLERVLPARLRPRLTAVGGAASVVPHPDAPGVDPLVLGVLAACSRDRAVTDFAYNDRSGNLSERRVEPHHLVSHGGHWYLLAHDTDRDAWRTFRVDRLHDPRPTHGRFEPRELPAPDPATFLTRLFAQGTYRHTVTVVLDLPEEEVRGRLYGPLPGRIASLGPDRCEVRVSADSLDLVCQYTAVVLSLGAASTLDAPAEVRERLTTVAARISR